MKGSTVRFPYTDRHKNLFLNLENKSIRNKVKTYLVFIFPIILIFTEILRDNQLLHLKTTDLNNSENWVCIVVVYVFYFAITWMIKNDIYLDIFKISSDSFNEQILNFKLKKNVAFKLINYLETTINNVSKWKLKDILLFFISPDGFSSLHYKNKLEKRFSKSSKSQTVRCLKDDSNNRLDSQEIYYSIDENGNVISTLDWSRIRIERKFFIEWSNWANLIFTTVSCILIYILLYIFESNFLRVVIFSFLIFRMISRGVEIGLSFYVDVATINSKIFYKNEKTKCYKHILDEDSLINNIDIVYINGFKSSLLRSQGRLSLAMHTLIELFFLFSAIYFMTYIFFDTVPHKHSTPFGAFLYSISVGVFNFSYNEKFLILPQGAFHVSQILLSVVLILLSIAQYLGKNDEVNSDDQDLYKFVARKRMYNKISSFNKEPSDEFKSMTIHNLTIIYRCELKIESYKNCIHIKNFDGKPLIEIYDSGYYKFLGSQKSGNIDGDSVEITL